MIAKVLHTNSYSIRPLHGHVTSASGDKKKLRKDDNSKNSKELQDSFTLSDEAKKILNKMLGLDKDEKKANAPNDASASERKRVAELRRRDKKVRSHEMAHKMAGGMYTGQVVYEYTTGPDGKRYVKGGRVSIDTSEAATPEKTLAKAATIRRAALAPSDPSPADRRVAAKAQAMSAKARRDISNERAQEMKSNMAEFNQKFNASMQGEIVDLSEIFGVKLNSNDDASNNNSIKINTKSKSFISASRVNAAYGSNSSLSSQAFDPSNIKVSSSVPSRSILAQSEEEIQEEAVPDIAYEG